MKMKKGKNGLYPYTGFLNCFLKSIRKEGFFGLWVGFSAFYCRLAPHSMTTILTQDILHDLFLTEKY